MTPRERRGWLLAGVVLVVAAVLFEPLRRLVTGHEIVSVTKRLYLGWLRALLAVAGLAIATRWRRPSASALAVRLASGMAFLTLLELGSAVAFRLLYHEWHFRRAAQTRMYDRHPYLGVVPRPGARLEQGRFRATHTAEGFRGTRGPSAGDGLRIVAIGGSATYGSSLSDDETWPHRLEERLGPPRRVFNLGFLGYTTAEHVIQTAFLLGDLGPRVAIYYVGWNDVRVSHLPRLAADYSDFHALSLPSVLRVSSEVIRGSRHLAFPTLVLKALGQAHALDIYPDAPPQPAGPPVAGVDPRALALYERNLSSLVALCREKGITPVLAPQVYNPAALTSDRVNPWSPMVRDRDLPAIADAYNQKMAGVAREEHVSFVGSLLAPGWQPADFQDAVHFTPRGADRLAGLLEEHLRKEALLGP